MSSNALRWARPAGWLLLLTLGFGIRMGAGVWWQDRLPAEQRFGFADSNSYWLLGQTIVRGEPYQFGGPDLRVFRTPGYPLLLAGMFAIVGDDASVLWGRAVSAICGILAVGGVAWLAWQLFDERAAWLAAGFATLYPGAIAISALVLSEAPFCPLMLLQLNGWVWAWKSPSRRTTVAAALLAGAAAGCATLMRPSWLLFTPLALIVGMLGPRRGRQLWIGGWMILALCLVMSPWWIRNYRVVGRFVPTTLQVGASLYDGWNPTANGGSDMRFVYDYYERQKEDDARRTTIAAGTFEERLDRRLRDDAIAWARENPGRVIHLAWIKFARMWNPLPNAQELQSARVRAAVMLGFTPLLAAGLVGLWVFRDRGWTFWLCYLPAGYFTFLHIIFVASIRYRQPAMLPICAVAGGLLSHAWRRWRLAGRIKATAS